MRYTIKESDGVIIISPAVSVHSTEAEHLREEIFGLISQGKRRFLFDMSGVKYIDSSGLGVMMAVNKKVKPHGEQVMVCGLSGTVLELFQLTCLDKYFIIL